MKTRLLAVVCAVGLACAAGCFAKQKKDAPTGATVAAALESKVRQAWEDYKNKKKDAFAAVLTEDYTTVEVDGSGLRDKKAEVAEIDQFDITNYSLSDFVVKPIGPGGTLVIYKAEYAGTAGGQPVHDKVVTGEVWVKRGGEWECLHGQMTKAQ